MYLFTCFRVYLSRFLVYLFPYLPFPLYTCIMQLTLESVYLLLFIATLVAIVTQRVHIPYTVGLVIAGIVVSFLPFTLKIELSRELIFTTLLPPLIFEATLFIRWRESITRSHVFRRDEFAVENNITGHAGD